MSTALTVSDRAAEIVAWVESLEARPPCAPACLGDANVQRRVQVHELDAGAFEAIRAVGREHWSYGTRKGVHWLVYQPSHRFEVALFRK